ncbi:BEACH domain-containing protein lvsA-like [Cynara cardunculus var. scolymus]|uniref:BEACH domain-containing protein lvsA-like n=1 Tax=Cynara cardunculus var. scolymus TaxID=59895 RepID=UPI000D62F948|nr:BEACH domain-containing protein lvsA-like [Cynara cardunculus var. scolymus]
MVIASMWASMAAWFTPIVLFGLMNLIVATIFIANNNNKRHDQRQVLANNNNNNNKHYDQGEDQVYGNSSSRIAGITSLFERSKPISVSSCIAAITTAESRQKNPSQPKKATYSSLSRLAQSIYFPTIHGTRSNGDDLYQSGKAVGAGSQLERVKSVRFSSTDSENIVLTESSKISNSPGQLVRAPSFIERVKSFKISSPSKSGAPLTEHANIDTGRTAKADHHAIRSKSEKSSVEKSVVEIKKTRSEIRLPSDDEEDVDSRRPATARERRNAGDAGVDAKADDFITRFRQQLKLQRVESLVRYNDILQRRTSN